MRYPNLNHVIVFLFSILLTFSCAKDEDLFGQAIDQNIQDEIKDQEEDSTDEDSTDEDSTDEEETPTDETPSEEEPVDTGDSVGDTGQETTLKAFPTAVGAGAYNTGGRGGDVYHVTNLNNSGSGSLRDAVSSSNRIIVFDVSGVITLTSRLSTSANNITIAGQTAPSGGITIDGDSFMVYQADNWIIRYVRFRGGYASSTTNDSFGTLKSSRIYLDHCSFSFGTDEAGTLTEDNASWADIGQSTMAHCFLAESKTGTIMKGTQGYTSYLNLYYNITHRFPNFAINGVGAFDIINNVAWNYQNRLVRGNDAADLLHIGNYANIGTTPLRDDRINQYQYTGVEPTIYTSGNIIEARNSQAPYTYTVDQMNDDNKLMWSFFDGTRSPYREDDRLPSNWFTNSRREFLGVAPEVLTAQQALNYVINDVGANKSLNANGSYSNNMDDLDANWLANVSAGTYASKMSTSEYKVPTGSNSTNRASSFDSDRDGMPDDWEISMGFNPNVDDSKGDHDGDGYTNIEEYINLVDY